MAKLKYDVRILVLGDLDNIPVEYINYVSQHNNIIANEDDIVIYPDGVTNNPLKAKNVVRYLLAPEYMNTATQIEYGKTDYILSYSYQVDSIFPQLFILNPDEEILSRDINVNKKSILCVYYGKYVKKNIGYMKKKLDSIANQYQEVIEIDRDYPKCRKQLINILSEAELLVSFDPLSSINYEATLCGTPVYVLDDKTFGDLSTQKFNLVLFGFFSDYKKLNEKKEEVKKAKQQYKIYLEDNINRIEKAIEDIEEHFSNIKNIEHYAKRTYERNVLRKQLISLKISNDKIFLFSNRTGYVSNNIKGKIKKILPYGLVQYYNKKKSNI